MISEGFAYSATAKDIPVCCYGLNLWASKAFTFFLPSKWHSQTESVLQLWPQSIHSGQCGPYFTYLESTIFGLRRGRFAWDTTNGRGYMHWIYNLIHWYDSKPASMSLDKEVNHDLLGIGGMRHSLRDFSRFCSDLFYMKSYVFLISKLKKHGEYISICKGLHSKTWIWCVNPCKVIKLSNFFSFDVHTT